MSFITFLSRYDHDSYVLLFFKIYFSFFQIEIIRAFEQTAESTDQNSIVIFLPNKKKKIVLFSPFQIFKFTDRSI